MKINISGDHVGRDKKGNKNDGLVIAIVIACLIGLTAVIFGVW